MFTQELQKNVTQVLNESQLHGFLQYSPHTQLEEHSKLLVSLSKLLRGRKGSRVNTL